MLESIVDTFGKPAEVIRVNLPKLKNLGLSFQNCSSLEELNLPKVTTVSSKFPDCFRGCTSLKELRLPLYSPSSTLLSSFVPNLEILEIGYKGTWTFEGFEYLKELILPNINGIVLNSMSSLDGIALPAIVECDSSNKFGITNCPLLKTVDMPNCTSLKWGSYSTIWDFSILSTLKLSTKEPVEVVFGKITNTKYSWGGMEVFEAYLSNLGYFFYGARKLRELRLWNPTAFTIDADVDISTFSQHLSGIGSDVETGVEKTIHVPVGATGYEDNWFIKKLIEKGFVLVMDLVPEPESTV